MYGTPLFLIEKSCGISLQEALPVVLSRKVTHDQMRGFCTLYRRIGVARLFSTGLPDDYFENLSKSARAFLYFLEGADDRAKLTSRSEPFFDAIACDDLPAAKGIAHHSRQTWNAGEEYEEDFLYVAFLMKRFAADTSRESLEALLARYEQVLQGAEDSRLDLCRALLSAEQKPFDVALTRLVEERDRDIRKKLANERLSPDDVTTTARIWIELLALLRLAEQTGLALAEHYLLAPSIARRVNRARAPSPDAWRQLRSYYELG
ncbi:Imm49 family immunity protein [Pyxidicoccus xibeiensis]|uniref:Imm49 family immunity protein n=1 Tax=Pyxidicoccus xibeiensis TaxID=2906759 RepID=UPI0020A77EA5|nr:Imm49 family immunity protein [Pyxidicoccus xibeiensis]MCP3137894.1 immunity 49 family protein [Pyxidicoccus xibeiensis]